VHASASPFEALAELNNWCGMPFNSVGFGKDLLAAGISECTIKAWSVDPQVNIGGGKKGSLFDAVEDMDSTECLAKLKELDGMNKCSGGNCTKKLAEVVGVATLVGAVVLL